MNHVAKDAHQLAGKLKALADETRLQMALLLTAHAELCVCDFEHALGISQSKASRHLHSLLNTGLVDDRRENVWIYYRLADDLEPALQNILASVTAALDPDVLPLLDAQLQRWLETRTCDEGAPCVPR